MVWSEIWTAPRDPEVLGINPVPENLSDFRILDLTIITSKSNSLQVGINSLANSLFYIKNEIPLNWLNMSMDTYKCHQFI